MSPSSSSIEAVEELVERELTAHNKPSIQVSMILHITFIYTVTLTL